MTQTSSYTAWPGVFLLPQWNKEPELKLNLEIRISDDVAVVTCKGRIVYRNEVAALSCTVADLLPHARQLVLELSQVETMDGAGVGELMALLALVQARGGTLKLAAPSKGVRELLELTRVASAFAIHDTVDDALNTRHARARAVSV
jgi:anti-anti-sigma factor